MKSIRPIIILFWIGVVLLTGCGGKSSKPVTPATPKMLITLDNSTVNVGQAVVVTLAIQDFPDSVFGIGLQLDYDDSIAAFDDSTGMTIGDFLGADILQFARDTDSALHISLTKFRGQSGSTGSGVIAYLTFGTTGNGQSVFSIERANLNLYDSEGNPINISDLEIGSAELRVN